MHITYIQHLIVMASLFRNQIVSLFTEYMYSEDTWLCVRCYVGVMFS